MGVVCGVERELTKLRYAKAGFSRQADLSVVAAEQPHKNGQPDGLFFAIIGRTHR